MAGLAYPTQKKPEAAVEPNGLPTPAWAMSKKSKSELEVAAPAPVAPEAKPAKAKAKTEAKKTSRNPFHWSSVDLLQLTLAFVAFASLGLLVWLLVTFGPELSGYFRHYL